MYSTLVVFIEEKDKVVHLLQWRPQKVFRGVGTENLEWKNVWKGEGMRPNTQLSNEAKPKWPLLGLIGKFSDYPTTPEMVRSVHWCRLRTREWGQWASQQFYQGGCGNLLAAPLIFCTPDSIGRVSCISKPWKCSDIQAPNIVCAEN